MPCIFICGLDARVLKSPVQHGGVNVETPSRKTLTGDGLFSGMSDVCAETRFDITCRKGSSPG